MRKASTWMLEKGTQTPSPSPDHIPAEHKNKTLTGNSHTNWYIERGHLIVNGGSVVQNKIYTGSRLAIFEPDSSRVLARLLRAHLRRYQGNKQPCG
jgi:hypothetical protein